MRILRLYTVVEETERKPEPRRHELNSLLRCMCPAAASPVPGGVTGIMINELCEE